MTSSWLTPISCACLALCLAAFSPAALAKPKAKSKRAPTTKVVPFVIFESWDGLTEKVVVGKAQEVAKQEGLVDADILIKILLQETHLGKLGSFWRAAGRGLKSEPYYGIGQIKLTTAMDVVKSQPQLAQKYKVVPDEDVVRAHLTINDKFNAAIAAQYLKQLGRQYQGDELLNAYNRGPTGVKGVNPDFHYAVGANKKFYAMFPEKKPPEVTLADCLPYVLQAQTQALGSGVGGLGVYNPAADPLLKSGKPSKTGAAETVSKTSSPSNKKGSPTPAPSDAQQAQQTRQLLLAQACGRLSNSQVADLAMASQAPGSDSKAQTLLRQPIDVKLLSTAPEVASTSPTKR